MIFGVCFCKKIERVRPSDFDEVTPNEVKLSNIDPI
jgi:hypothetical protein